MVRVRKNVIFFVLLNVIASGFNYLTYPVLAHALPNREFVNITVALSLFTQVSTFLSSIVAVTIGLSKQSNQEHAAKKIEQLQMILMQLFVLLIVAFLILSPFIMGRVRLPAILAIPISILMLISIPTAILSGFLNGRNKLVKLGVLILTIATFQLVFSVSVGIVTQNGALALLAMAMGQVISIGLVYILFRSERLPKPYTFLSSTLTKQQRVKLWPLIKYTVLISLAIMMVNIAQIADLLIIKSWMDTSSVRIYTDVYIFSRVVFFAGTIFIWPFLAIIDINNLTKNILPFIKLVGLFILIGLVATLVIALRGEQLLKLLFGDSYPQSSIFTLSLLSILYKTMFLIISATVLYLVVLHDYWAIWLTAGLGIGVALFGGLGKGSNDSQSVLVSLNVIAGVVMIAGLGALLWRTRYQSD
jgi:O-antigen/teichoic acid export membrane protein